jgi:hypothetical protein
MRICFDTETATHYAADGIQAPVCLTWAPEDDKSTGRIAVGDDAIDLWDAWVSDPSITLIAHNAPFDCAVLAKASALRAGTYTRPGAGPAYARVFGLYRTGRILDTIPRQRLIDVATGRAGDDTRMGTLAKRLLHLDIGDDKKIPSEWAHLLGTPVQTWPTEAREATPWRFKYGLLQGVALEHWPDDARRYACEDPVITWGIFDWQEKKARKVFKEHGGEIVNEREQARAAWDLHLFSLTGFATDRPHVQRLIRLYSEIERVCSDLLVAHCALCGAPVIELPDPKTVKALQEQGAIPGDPQLGDCPTCHERVTLVREDVTFRGGRKYRGEWQAERRERVKDRKAAQRLVWRVLGSHAPQTKTARERGLPRSEGTVATDADTLVKVAAELADGRDGLLKEAAVLVAAEDGTLLEVIRATTLPIVNAVRLYSRAQKYQSAFLRPFDTDQRVRTSYQICKDTGRVSSRRPSTMNIPRPNGLSSENTIRACIIADPGHSFLVSDYGQIELVGFAHVLNKLGEMNGRGTGYQSSLARAINAGMDGHIMVAAEVLRVDYDTALAAYKSGKAKNGLTQLERDVIRWRQVGKIQNYGAAGGMGAATFVAHASKQDAVISQRESEIVREAWLRAWSPDVPDYFKYFTKLTQTSGRADITQLYSGRLRGKATFTQCCNCLDDQTEALTRTRGWVRGFDLIEGEEILAKDPKTGRLQWERAGLRLWDNYTGDLHTFRTASMELVSTPDHRWLVSDRHGKVMEKRTHEISDCGEHKIHLTGLPIDQPEQHGVDFCTLAGWYLTDGGAKGKHAIMLYQTKQPQLDQIRALLTRMGLAYLETNFDGAMRIYVNVCDTTRKLRALFPARELTPAFMAGLSPLEARATLDAMIAGDGTVIKSTVGKTSFCAVTPQRVAMFQQLCTMNGIASTTYYREGVTSTIRKTGQVVRGGGHWIVCLKRRDKAQVARGQRTVTPVVNARVWCPVVESTFFVARRKGFVFITGNTMFQALCADGAKYAMSLIIEACYLDSTSPLYGCTPVLFVHDEFVLSCPHGREKEAGAELSRLMIKGMARYIPDIKIEADCAVMSRWGKS